jgi:hypothetical protein
MSRTKLVPRAISPADFDAMPPPREPARRSTGLATLDALLGGGLPVGPLVELSGQRSSGKSTLAFHVCSRALELRAAAWIGPRSSLWPIASLEAGLDTERLLVVHTQDGLSSLRAAQIVLSCPSAVATLVVDLPFGFHPRPAQLHGLQRLAERSETVLVLLTERARQAPSLAPSVALRLHVERAGGGLREREGALLADVSMTVEVLRHKSGPTQRSSEERIHGPDRLCAYCTL